MVIEGHPREWTPSQRLRAVIFFTGLSTTELRRRQRLIEMQRGLAYRQRKTNALEDMDVIDHCIIRAILARC